MLENYKKFKSHYNFRLKTVEYLRVVNISGSSFDHFYYTVELYDGKR